MDDPRGNQCKRKGCTNLRPPGHGYCSHECYWEAQGRLDDKRRRKDELAQQMHEDERRNNPRTRLADLIFSGYRYEFERDEAMTDLIDVIKKEMQDG